MTSTPTPVIPEEQLLELLIQLQKTTPEQARAILNAQPAIGYALVPLMAKMGILNLDVLQKTLATYAGQAAPQAQVPAAPVPPPVPTIPAHLTQSQPYVHQPTPPPTIPNAYGVLPSQPAAPSGGYPGYPPPVQAQAQNGAAVGYPPSQYGGQYQQQVHQPQQQQAAPPAGLAALGSIPDDQKEMIMRVISMTPEQIRSLPPHERAITIQLRTTLGLPAE